MERYLNTCRKAEEASNAYFAAKSSCHVVSSKIEKLSNAFDEGDLNVLGSVSAMT